ncbi:phage terminase large subunit, partial [Arthrospira platensis SPKY2]
GKIIIIMTRWHSEDLAGKALKELPATGYKVKHINLKAYDEEKDVMLCEGVLTKEEYFRKVKTMGEDIASANYQQQPIDLKGRLYQNLQIYTNNSDYIKIWNYTDTADKGADYLCSICFGETAEHQAEILDVVYTKDDMSKTEPATADMIARNRVNEAVIEGNNGGVGFKRSVERISRSVKGNSLTVFKDFHQSANKDSRILSNATWIEQNVFFPEDWRIRWPDFYEAINKYQKEGKNKHDDAPDALTGVSEVINKKIKLKAKIAARPSWI